MNKSHLFGYLLGLLIFVIGIPALMWLVSGRPPDFITFFCHQIADIDYQSFRCIDWVN